MSLHPEIVYPLPDILGERIEYLSADRSEQNESKNKSMAGCLHVSGVVVAYIPYGQRASLFAMPYTGEQS